MQTRRAFLKMTALISGAGFAGLIPESIRRAYAIVPESRSTWVDAEHVVILMQENRSFDHSFGTLRGVRGFNDPRALRLPNGNSVFVQTDAAGNSYAPWRLDIRDTRITWMGSLPHSRESQVDAWNEGRYDQWLEAKRSGEEKYADVPMTMGHYTREDLPFYYALADAFTICDQNYCSVMSCTSPNRCCLWTGTIRDRQTADSNVFIRNEQIDYGGLDWKTFCERLQEAGIPWKAYQNELTRSPLSGDHDAWLSNFGDNSLECFNAYNVEASPGFAAAANLWIDEWTEEVQKLESAIATARDPAEAAQMRVQIKQAQDNIRKAHAALANCGEKRYSQLTDEQKALFHAAFVTNASDPDYHALEPLSFTDKGRQMSMQVPKGDILYQFRKDVNEGRLPAISWLTAPENFSDHPTSPWYGAWYISEVMDILTSNPAVWKKTIFILTYDENDGYFDHVPPFVAADPKRPETGGASAGVDTGLEYTYQEHELAIGVTPQDARTGPIGLGFRVPMIVASPWTRGGWVNSQVFDHTSTLQFLERFVQAKFDKAVQESNISAWRRTVTGDLTSVFRPYDASEPHLDFLQRDEFVVGIEKARYKEIPSNYQKLTEEQIARINRAPMHSEYTAHQEKGSRPACPLPYELYADGNRTSGGEHWELRLTAGNQMHGQHAAGAPFNVYLRHLNNGSEMLAASFAVKAGDTLTRQFPLAMFAGDKYFLEVYGPNGFYRAFSGRAALPEIVKVRTAYELNAAELTGNVQVHLRNTAGQPVSVTITDHSYGAAAVRKELSPSEATAVVLPLQSSHGWYDFTVKADGSDAEARYAGRVETGRPSVSDPAIGGLDDATSKEV
ncbi:MAG TPA: phospholipase C, phosphocholine-specific [Terriglobia bacterium]|nr:phospholipase C, phosphocholine-specific [Terriglobia bacterium]